MQTNKTENQTYTTYILILFCKLFVFNIKCVHDSVCYIYGNNRASGTFTDCPSSTDSYIIHDAPVRNTVMVYKETNTPFTASSREFTVTSQPIDRDRHGYCSIHEPQPITSSLHGESWHVGIHEWLVVRQTTSAMTTRVIPFPTLAVYDNLRYDNMRYFIPNYCCSGQLPLWQQALFHSQLLLFMTTSAMTTRVISFPTLAVYDNLRRTWFGFQLTLLPYIISVLL